MCRDMDKKSAYGFQQQSSYYLLLFERVYWYFSSKYQPLGLIPGLGRFPGEGAWQTTTHGVA